MLRSLHRRPRSRALAQMLNSVTSGAIAPTPASHEPPRSLPAEVDLVRRELAVAGPTDREAAGILYDRLDRRDIETMEQRLDPELRALWDRAGDEDRRVLAPSLCIHFGVEGVSEKTGLLAATPPEEVHAMGRGPLAAGGSIYYADLVLEALRRGGGDPAALRRALDFGCSSGRVVRVLNAVLPDVQWHGCDPIAPAIEWARANLSGIDFRVSPQEPPLPYEDDSFDFIYAISIWSHFGESAALRWLEEMRRVLRRDGLLAFSVQSHESLAHYGRSGLWYTDDLLDAAADLFARGFHYRDGFGEDGDHGIKNPEWGMAFLTTEWLLAHVTPEWSLTWLATGRAESNQDVIVLQRRV